LTERKTPFEKDFKMNFSITKNGKRLNKSRYTWDEDTKTLSTDENGLVLDFSGWNGVSFKTGFGCTFKTGYECTFKTGSECTFKTGSECTFKTGSYCTFQTGDECTFKTGYGCTFQTSSDCTFTVGKNCFGVRYDVAGVNEFPEGVTVKYGEYGVPGIVEVAPEPVEVTLKLTQDQIEEIREIFRIPLDALAE
jgi:hypothetical protein